MDGAPLRGDRELQERIYNSRPGTQPSLVVERAGDYRTIRPTLTAWPSLSY
jgi:S1-C subfamily serine protease